MTIRTLARSVEFASWGFVALGVSLPFAFATPAFAPYREALARWAFASASIPESDDNLLGLMLGITGASIAGKWLVHALLARGPLAEGRAWARDLTLRGLAAWFVVDSSASLMLGATFNVWMINLAPLAFVGLPVFLSYGNFRDTDDATAPLGPASRVAMAATLLGASSGLAIAFGGSTPLFHAWWQGLDASMGPVPAPSRQLALFFFGPVGGCTLAQFLMLAGWLRREGPSRRVVAAAISSIVAWFALDSAFGLAHDGLFNIALVNLPALAMTLPPWWWLARTRRD